MNKTFLKLLLPLLLAFSPLWAIGTAPGMITKATLVVSKSIVIADNQDSATITATFLDKDNDPITNIMSTGGIWLLQEQNGVLVDVASTVDASQSSRGVYKFEVKSSHAGFGRYSVRATADDARGREHTRLKGSVEVLYLNKPTEETHFESAHPYENGTNITKTLSIPDAEHIYMSLRGEIARGDYVSVNGVRYSGDLDEILDISGDSVEVVFFSNDNTTKDGIVVDIINGEPDTPTRKTHFETAHPYANNTTMNETLTIPGADELTLRLTGVTEKNYDFVYINGTRYHGVLDETIDIEGDSVEVRFTSDYSVVKSGVTIDIE